MNANVIQQGGRVIKTLLKVSLIMGLIGLVISSYALVQSDIHGNYYEINSGITNERYLGYFEEGTNLQLGVSIVNMENNQEEFSYSEEVLHLVLLKSSTSDFADSSVRFELRSAGVYRDLNLEEGYYKLQVTNLTGDRLEYVVGQSESSLGTLIVLAIGLILITIALSLVWITISLSIAAVFILGLIYIVKLLIEDNRKKREIVKPLGYQPTPTESKE